MTLTRVWGRNIFNGNHLFESLWWRNVFTHWPVKQPKCSASTSRIAIHFIMIGSLVGEMLLFPHYWWWNVLINISHFSSFCLLGVLAMTSWELNCCLVEIFVQLGQLIYSFGTYLFAPFTPSDLLPPFLAAFTSSHYLLPVSAKGIMVCSYHDLDISLNPYHLLNIADVIKIK